MPYSFDDLLLHTITGMGLLPATHLSIILSRNDSMSSRAGTLRHRCLRDYRDREYIHIHMYVHEPYVYIHTLTGLHWAGGGTLPWDFNPSKLNITHVLYTHHRPPPLGIINVHMQHTLLVRAHTHTHTFMMEEKVSLLASVVASFFRASSLRPSRKLITLSCRTKRDLVLNPQWRFSLIPRPAPLSG